MVALFCLCLGLAAGIIIGAWPKSEKKEDKHIDFYA